ncbi:tetratricopeptide repeat protein [Pseudanabaena yagii]|uniref:Tetratricopeptide repeat protein n=1 Tax=Pseudanabaena yagii GIHE-NHR1 TaxID=2722753 RepID=A0ABX1LSH4_9CYAN|nr:tetratricopeptide repeat protein [Pseudanabaena yagii]NMF58243.1 tetratricopeptide repeat protein [Pseudanabaena yagii GIHE-NHR1]
MTNKRTGLEHVNVGGDADINVSQEIHHEPNKVADKVGIVAQAESVVNIENFNQIIQEAKRAGSLINLPQSNVTFFAGRDDDLQEVHKLLQQNHRVAVAAFVKGMGGIGKSELALQYGLRHLQDYGGGIFWLRANEGNLPTQLQDFVVVQLGEKMPDGLDSGEKLAGYCWARLGKSLKGQMLVILDDVKDYAKVEPFLPPLDGNFRVLATTRLGLGNAMQQYTLDVLELAAAVDLLRSFLPEADPRRGSEAEIEQLCEWLGRLPLAIELVGRYLARKPDLSIAKMQERLEMKKLQQDALTDKQRRALTEMTAKLNVIAAFDLSWQDLSEGAQRLGCLLSLFALAPIDWRWVMDAMGEDEEDLEAWRDDELLNLHLLERTGEGEYALHQLLREYFQFQLQQHPQWQALRQQVAVSLLNISKGIGQTITIDQVKEIAPTIPHLEILGRELLEHIPNPAEDLVWAFLGIASYYRGQGLYALSIPPLETCLKETESRLGADHLDVATSLNNLAELYDSQGKYSEAEPLYVRSLSIKEKQLGADHPSVATSLNNLAGLYYSQGKYSEAEPLLLRSLEIDKRIYGEDHPEIATDLNNLAELYRSQGKYSEAEPLYVRSLSIMEKQLGADHPYVASSLNNLASLYESQGKYSEAEPLYLRSLSIKEKQLGADHPSVANSLNNLAGLYESQGKYSEAEPLFLRSLEIFIKVLGQDHPHTQTVMVSLMMLRLQISTGMSSEALQQMIANNPDDIMQLLQAMNPNS